MTEVLGYLVLALCAALATYTAWQQGRTAIRRAQLRRELERIEHEAYLAHRCLHREDWR